MLSSSWFRWSIVLLVGFLCSGCGKVGGAVVNGNLKLDGQPLADAQVQLHPKTDEGLGVHIGFTDSQGNFTIQGKDSGRPIKAGTYVAVITKFTTKSSESMEMVSIVPSAYTQRDTTPLTVEIKDGNNRLEPFQVISEGKK